MPSTETATKQKRRPNELQDGIDICIVIVIVIATLVGTRYAVGHLHRLAFGLLFTLVVQLSGMFYSLEALNRGKRNRLTPEFISFSRKIWVVVTAGTAGLTLAAMSIAGNHPLTLVTVALDLIGFGVLGLARYDDRLSPKLSALGINALSIASVTALFAIGS